MNHDWKTRTATYETLAGTKKYRVLSICLDCCAQRVEVWTLQADMVAHETRLTDDMGRGIEESRRVYYEDSHPEQFALLADLIGSRKLDARGVSVVQGVAVQ